MDVSIISQGKTLSRTPPIVKFKLEDFDLTVPRNFSKNSSIKKLKTI